MGAPAGACPAKNRGHVDPTPAAAERDKSDVYYTSTDCFARHPYFIDRICTRGEAHATTRIALVGNSHAAEYLPAVEKLAKVHHWKITTYLASQCAASAVAQTFPQSSETQACTDWVHWMTKQVTAGHFDLVIMADKVAGTAVGHSLSASYPIYQSGYQQVLAAFKKAHVRLLAIRDSPSPYPTWVPRCLMANMSNYSSCNGTRSKWLPPEPMFAAIDAMHDPNFSIVDLTNWICRPVVCPAVVGGVIVYFDESHLTATYAATLAPYLDPAVDAALGRKLAS